MSSWSRSGSSFGVAACNSAACVRARAARHCHDEMGVAARLTHHQPTQDHRIRSARISAADAPSLFIPYLRVVSARLRERCRIRTGFERTVSCGHCAASVRRMLLQSLVRALPCPALPSSVCFRVHERTCTCHSCVKGREEGRGREGGEWGVVGGRERFTGIVGLVGE
jgi:hypothetical protein